MSRFEDIAVELESCTNLIGEDSLAEVEKAFGVPIGKELRQDGELGPAGPDTTTPSPASTQTN